MKGIKGIDELYEEVRDFDLVVTNDAALATALNGRIDRPVVGYFALTPIQIALRIASRVSDEPLSSELKVLSEISEDTGFSIKYVHSEVENIREIRKYTKDVRKHLHSQASRAVHDSYGRITTLESLMGDFIPEEDEFYKGLSVAVIEEELFNDLDKHFIPLKHESVTIFKDEPYEIGTIYEIGNDRQLAENTADMIDPDHADDYAIVLNTDSPLVDSVRASLYRKGLPFINSLSVRDLSQVRDYLQFITLAMDFETVRVKHVKELFSNYNGFFVRGREGFLLCKQTESDMRSRAWELWNVMRDIRSMTYSQICDAICDRRTKIQVSILINDLQVADKLVTSVNLNEVKYAVDNVWTLHHNEEIPENEKRGVLLVDCNNSVYIDRPVVFYLGMEQDWNKNLVGKKYIDIEDETDRNAARLTALIQQGSVRYYFVNSTKGGKTARPCMMFDLIYKRPVNSFSLMCGELIKGRWHQDDLAIIPEDLARGMASGRDLDRRFSKSSFDNYYACPRKFMYGLFLSTPEVKVTEFGELIHSFAEFYVCYPGDVRDLGLDYFVDLTSDRYSGLSSPLMEELDRAKIRLAMSAVVRYMDHIGVKDVPLDVPLSSKKYPNRFMTLLGKEYTSSVCEVDFESSRYPIHGQLDLYWDGVVTDYKTGNPKSADTIAKEMTPGSGYKNPEFQAPIYLGLVQEQKGNRDMFKLFYAMENDTASAGGTSPIESNVRTITLLHCTVKQAIVGSTGLREFLGTAMSKNLREKVDIIMEVIDEMASEDISAWDQDEGLVRSIVSAVGLSLRNKDDIQTVKRGLRKIMGLAKGGLIRYGTAIEMTEPFLHSVLDMVSDMHDRMKEQSRTDFPPAPRIKCSDCKYISVCTKDPVDLGGDNDERAERTADQDRRCPRGDDRRRCGSGDREDPYHRRALCAPHI